MIMNKKPEGLPESYKKDQNDPFILPGPALEYIAENEMEDFLDEPN